MQCRSRCGKALGLLRRPLVKGGDEKTILKYWTCRTTYLPSPKMMQRTSSRCSANWACNIIVTQTSTLINMNWNEFITWFVKSVASATWTRCVTCTTGFSLKQPSVFVDVTFVTDCLPRFVVVVSVLKRRLHRGHVFAYTQTKRWIPGVFFYCSTPGLPTF